ncbi:MAG: hypothetical protein AMXMBFR47_00110 [Planctomycetota bacterium]
MLFHQRLGLSVLVVGVNAAPAALIAWWVNDRVGVAAGLAVWFVIYAVISQTNAARAALNDRRFRRSITIALLLRCVPLCWIPDLMVGGFVERAIFRFHTRYDPLEHTSATTTFLAVLFHGLAMSGVFWGLVALITYRMFLTDNRKERQNLCVTCGYDLRASPVRCPECGTPNPSPGAGPAVSDFPPR